MDNVDIEELIEKASSSRADNDYNALFLHLRNAEVFFNIVTTTDEQGEQQAHIPTSEVGDGLVAMTFYSSSEHPELEEDFGGMPWVNSIEMLLTMDEVDGVVICNNAGEWVPVARTNLEVLLDIYKEADAGSQ